MKIINYDYGFIPLFDCVIKGKIQMTKEEFAKIQKYLFNPAVKSYYLDKRLLRRDLNRQLPLNDKNQVRIDGKTPAKFWVNIRVTATEKLVKRFGLEKYKRNNYVLEVI